MQSEQLNYIPIFMQLLLAVGFVAGTIFVSGKLGPKRTSQSKDKNFECGIESVVNARIPFSVKYFVVAILSYYSMWKLFSYILGQSTSKN